MRAADLTSFADQLSEYNAALADDGPHSTVTVPASSGSGSSEAQITAT